MIPLPMTIKEIDKTFESAIIAATNGGADVARGEIARLSRRLERGESHPGITELDTIAMCHEALDSGDAAATVKAHQRAGDVLWQRIKASRSQAE